MALTSVGHDISSVSDWARDPGDEEILARAFDEHRVLVTLDKDFGELAVVRGLAHAGIVRLVNLRVADQGPACA